MLCRSQLCSLIYTIYVFFLVSSVHLLPVFCVLSFLQPYTYISTVYYYTNSFGHCACPASYKLRSRYPFCPFAVRGRPFNPSRNCPAREQRAASSPPHICVGHRTSIIQQHSERGDNKMCFIRRTGRSQESENSPSHMCCLCLNRSIDINSSNSSSDDDALQNGDERCGGRVHNGHVVENA